MPAMWATVELEVHMDHYRPNSATTTGGPIDGAWYGHGVHLVDQMIALFGALTSATYDLRATRELGAKSMTNLKWTSTTQMHLRLLSKQLNSRRSPTRKWVLHGTAGTYITNIDQQNTTWSLASCRVCQDSGWCAPRLWPTNLLQPKWWSHWKGHPHHPRWLRPHLRRRLRQHCKWRTKVDFDSQMLAVIEICKQGSMNQHHISSNSNGKKHSAT